MTVYVENVIADNFFLTYLIAQLSYKIGGVYAKKRRSVIAASLGTAVALVYPLIKNNFALFAVKAALYAAMCAILYTGKNKPIMALVFLCVTAVFGGIIFLVSFTVFGNVEQAVRGGGEFSPGIIIFIGWVIYKIAWKCAVRRKRKKFDEQCIVEVTLSICGTEISVKGLVDSGNRLYDIKSALPVMLLYKDERWKNAVESRKNDEFSGYIEISGVGGEKRKVPLYHPDRAEFVKNGKTERAENDFLVGLCDFALGGNYRFGAIIHPAIYGGLN